MKTNKLIAAALLPLLFSCAKENIAPAETPENADDYITVSLVPGEDAVTRASFDDNDGIFWQQGGFAGLVNANANNIKSLALDKTYLYNGNNQASFKFTKSELTDKPGPYVLYYPHHDAVEVIDGKYKIPFTIGVTQKTEIGKSTEIFSVVSKNAIDLVPYEEDTNYDNNGAEVYFKVVGSYIRILPYGGTKEGEVIDYIKIYDINNNHISGDYFVSVEVTGAENKPTTIALADGTDRTSNEMYVNFDEKPATNIDRADAKGIYAQVLPGKHQLAYEIHTKNGYTYTFKSSKETDFAFGSIKDVPLNIQKATQVSVLPVPEELYLVGDMTYVGWNHQNAMKMTRNGDAFTIDAYLRTQVKQSDNSIEDAEGFKFLLQNTGWEPAYVNGGDNTLVYYNAVDSSKDIKFTVDKSGYYTVTADFSTGKVTFTPKAPEKFYVWGAATTAGWVSEKAIELKSTENEFVFSAENIELKANQEFKFFSENSESTAYVNDGSGNVVFFDSPSDSDADKKFKVEKAGLYTITVNLSTGKLTTELTNEYPRVVSNNKENTYYMMPTGTENEYKATAYLGSGSNYHDFFIYYGDNDAYHENEYVNITFESESVSYIGSVSKDNNSGLGWWISDDNKQTKRLYDITLNTQTNQVTVKFAQGKTFWLIGTPFAGYVAFNKPDEFKATADENGIVTWNVTTDKTGDFKICGEHTLSDAFWDGEWYYSTDASGFKWSWDGDNNYSTESVDKSFDVKVFITGGDPKWKLNETGKFKIVFDTKNLKIKVYKL